jgi:hypothetical protein
VGGEEMGVHRRHLERRVDAAITHSGDRETQHDVGIVQTRGK